MQLSEWWREVGRRGLETWDQNRVVFPRRKIFFWRNKSECTSSQLTMAWATSGRGQNISFLPLERCVYQETAILSLWVRSQHYHLPLNKHLQGQENSTLPSTIGYPNYSHLWHFITTAELHSDKATRHVYYSLLSPDRLFHRGCYLYVSDAKTAPSIA